MTFALIHQFVSLRLSELTYCFDPLHVTTDRVRNMRRAPFGSSLLRVCSRTMAWMSRRAVRAKSRTPVASTNRAMTRARCPNSSIAPPSWTAHSSTARCALLSDRCVGRAQTAECKANVLSACAVGSLARDAPSQGVFGPRRSCRGGTCAPRRGRCGGKLDSPPVRAAREPAPCLHHALTLPRTITGFKHS